MQITPAEKKQGAQQVPPAGHVKNKKMSKVSFVKTPSRVNVPVQIPAGDANITPKVDLIFSQPAAEKAC